MKFSKKKILIFSAVLFLIFFSFLALIFVSREKKAQNLASNSTTSANERSQEKSVLKGFSFSPSSLSPSDQLAFYNQARLGSQVLTWSGDWQELGQNGSAAFSITKTAKNYGLLTIPIASFFNSSNGKTKLVRSLSTENLNSYKTAAAFFAQQNQPQYLGLGIEVNLLYESSPQDFSKFVSLFSDTYDAVKKVSPHTKVFTVFQLERLKGLQGGLFGGKNDPAKNGWSLFSQFSKTDLLVFTTYPGLIYHSANEIPADYYSEIKNHTDKEIAFSEIGWASNSTIKGWETTQQNQTDFVNRFFTLTKDLKPSFLIWSFLYDQKTSEPFSTMGLIDRTGQEKPAFKAWNKTN